MKLQKTVLAFIFVLVIVASSLGTVPSVRAQANSGVRALLKGSLPLVGPYSFDICSLASLGIISCSISFLVAEVYRQNVTLQVLDSPSELQMSNAESTSVTLAVGQPVQVLDLNFTYAGTIYSFPIPIPSVPVPGNIPIEISLSGILAKFLTGPLIGGIINNIASLNLDLNFTSEIRATLSSKGFVLPQTYLAWDVPSTDAFSSTLMGYTQDASLRVIELDSILGLGASLVLKLPLLSPINLFTPFNQPLLQVGSSSTPVPLGDWYHLAVQSPYSQATGSGWYLSGTSATISVADTSVASSGGSYKFNGWTGTSTTGYTGSQQSENLLVTGPANETAGWTFVPPLQQNPGVKFSPTEWMVTGIAAAIILIATVAVIMVVMSRRQKSPR